MGKGLPNEFQIRLGGEVCSAARQDSDAASKQKKANIIQIINRAQEDIGFLHTYTRKFFGYSSPNVPLHIMKPMLAKSTGTVQYDKD